MSLQAGQNKTISKVYNLIFDMHLFWMYPHVSKHEIQFQF